MQVLLLNTSDLHGGAAIAASRLLHALRREGVAASMLVCRRESPSPHVQQVKGKWRLRWRFVWERFVIWVANGFSRRHLFRVSIANTGFDVTRLPEFKRADVVHLHWVNQGMLSLADLRKIVASGKRVVWTLHDMWPATGICHHAYDCQAFRIGCHDCPFLAFPSPADLSARTFRRKQQAYGGVHANLSIVAVSRWLAEQVRQSALLGEKPIDTIPNTLSLDRFHLLDRHESRSRLGIARKRYVLLFGAARIDDPIKGFDFLRRALLALLARGRYARHELHLLLFGQIKTPRLLDHFPISFTHLGTVSDPQLISRLYSAANLTVSTSHYETFGQTLVEAQACGCLPLSFDGSGQTDIIAHKQTGYLARRLDIDNLADGIEWCLADGQRIDRRHLRAHVLRTYDESAIARRYIEVYQRHP